MHEFYHCLVIIIGPMFYVFFGIIRTQTKALLPHIPTWEILAIKNARLWQIAQFSLFFSLAIPFATWVVTLS